ncbi:ATP-sensitive inward rectifier potassium channel 8 [Pseudolycoriella hygida]|uniref:ATP-sensitive inward rectifier potassium channel 8 n=1 Tax=Pseudolycoriella hygida TaxID=35572 RepID=A0A9Q0NGY5_9DIPT|nr:ATP-sensitive inward rectifier potassium channel 8 [Pseudolycoriella hygida]
MIQSQSLPDKLKTNSPLYDAIDTPSGSPYSRRYPTTFFKNNKDNEHDEAKVSESPLIFTFESPNGSPYTRRIPASEKKDRNDEYQLKANWSPESSVKGGFDENDIRDIRDMHDTLELQDVVFPIELHRHQSMQSLRHRRDPHYQGNRVRKSKRVIDKSGERNIEFVNIPERGWRFFKDFVTTLIDEQWRYVITIFAFSFFACWILFAILWYLIAHAHGDLNVDPVTGERLSDGPVPCVQGCHNFASFLLFSIETQVSIGYGNKYPNEECPEAIFLMIIQVIIGIGIEGAMVGIVYAKMIRPSNNVSVMNFSKKALVCQRNSKLCLIFRVCDTRSSHVIDTKVEAFWFEERYSMEGEKLKNFHHALKLENKGRVFLIFPTTVCHVIDETSPLYDMSAKDLLEKRFELIVSITGSSRATGQMTQSRTSYLPKEVMWGNRFVNTIVYNKSEHVYEVDYNKFDDVIQIDTPLCSARRLDDIRDELKEFLNHDLSSEYYNEHLNLVGDGSVTEHFDTVSVFDHKPSISGMSQPQSVHQFEIQNSLNECNDMKNMFKELEAKLSQHSINLIDESKK